MTPTCPYRPLPPGTGAAGKPVPADDRIRQHLSARDQTLRPVLWERSEPNDVWGACRQSPLLGTIHQRGPRVVSSGMRVGGDG